MQKKGKITNCTFGGNSADEGSGAGVYWENVNTFPTPTLDIVNTILWANAVGETMDETAQLSGESASNVTVSYSVIQGLDNWSGNNNEDDDPLFVNLPVGNVRLLYEDPYFTPYRDTANDSEIPTDCQSGEFSEDRCDVDEDECQCEKMPDEDQGPRVIGSHADRGAYELPPSCPADFSGPEGEPDGVVNTTDLFYLLARMGQLPPADPDCNNTGCPSSFYPGALAPDKHIVDTNDLFILLAAFGNCPETESFGGGSESESESEYQECLELLPDVYAVLECMGIEF